MAGFQMTGNVSVHNLGNWHSSRERPFQTTTENAWFCIATVRLFITNLLCDNQINTQKPKSCLRKKWQALIKATYYLILRNSS